MAPDSRPEASGSAPVIEHAFLEGGGITGGLVRSMDWSANTLGPISTWPPNLKALLGTVLRARHPMLLWWGPELIQFYNDAFVPSLGVGKHPAALGQRGRESWAEVWPIVGAQIEAVMSRGESIWSEDALVPILRNGRIEEVHWTYGYSPVVDDAGRIAGTLIVCNETTARVVAERRLRVVRTLAETMARCLDIPSVIEAANAVVATAPHDIPFALAYRFDDAAGTPRVEASTDLEGAIPGSIDALVRQYAAGDTPKEPKLLPLPASARFSGGPWPEPSSQAFLAPLKGARGFTLVLGVSPRLPFDVTYRDFMVQFVEQIDLAFARVRAIQSRGGMETERRNLLLQAPMPTALLTGPHHFFELANPLYEQMVGRKVAGKTYLQAFPELEGTALQGILDDVYRTGKPFVASESLVRLDRDGDGKLEDGFFRFNLEPLRDGDGNVYGMMAVAFDITEQVNARRALEEAISEARRLVRQTEAAEARAATAARQLDTILRGVTEGITAQGADGTLLYANDAAARLSGFNSAAEMLSTPAQDIVRRFELLDEEGEPMPPDRLPSRIARQRTTPAEAVVCFRDLSTGEMRWSVVAATPVLSPGQEVEIVINVFRDVTSARQTEENLRFLTEASSLLGSSLDVEETLQILARLSVPRMADWCSIHLAPQSGTPVPPVIVAHADSAKVEWARKFNADHPPDPKASRGVGQVMRTGIPELYNEMADELLEASPRDEHLHLLRTVGMRSVMMVPLSTSGRVMGVITFIAAESGRRYTDADLTLAVSLGERAAYAVDNARLYAEAQTAARNAEEAGRFKDEFLATVSHELRTPLTAILGWSRILGEGRIEPGRLQKGLTVIERNAKAQAQLIDDILDVSRIVSGKVRMSLKRVNLANVVNEAVETVRPSAAAKGVEVAVNVQTLGEIVADEDRLRQVVWNLLSNAVKFTPKGGEVAVSGTRVDSEVAIAVRDNGKGISAAFLPRVFDRFRQDDSSTTRQQAGLGLGLAIVRHLVELHGGRVSAQSDGEGLGATFEVRLPIRAVEPSDASVPSEEAGETSSSLQSTSSDRLQGVHVLVVDDQDDARDLVATVLERAGATVWQADSVTAAMKMLVNSTVEVIVSDIGMPDEDGYTFLRRLRATGGSPTTRSLPALALTAYARGEDRDKALAAGFQEHVAKPIEPSKLIEALAGLVGR